VSELLTGLSGFVRNQNRIIREGYQAVIDGLSFVSKGSSLSEKRKNFNAFNLSEEVAVFNLTKPHSRLFGNATEVEVSKQVTLGGDCYIDGVAFMADAKMNATPLVKVTSPARAVITNCVFHRGASGGAASLLEVESGATAIIIGCSFVGTSTVAEAVVHTGAAGNVQIVGSSARNVTAWGANTTQTASLL